VTASDFSCEVDATRAASLGVELNVGQSALKSCPVITFVFVGSALLISTRFRTICLVVDTRNGRRTYENESEVRYAHSGVNSILNFKFLICSSDISIGTVPSSMISKSVYIGGFVLVHTLHFSVTHEVCEFAKLKVSVEGRTSH